MMLNHDIPYFKCLVRRSHFTKTDADYTLFDNAYAFAIQSKANHILTFHVMTDYGMVRSRVPISEIYLCEPYADVPYHFKQLWDCFGEDVSVITYGFLQTKRAVVKLKDGTQTWATYMFTIDWNNNPYSNTPSDYKCGHVLASDDGYLVCMPNNRLYWRDSNWVTAKFNDWHTIKVDTVLPSVESVSDKWITQDTDCFYYDISNNEK
jgi:hypothetical protein